MIPLLAFAVVVAVMYVEMRISQRHERALRRSGAYEPPGDVYLCMRFVYPACFVAMTVEGLTGARSAFIGTVTVLGHPLRLPSAAAIASAGVLVLAASKALKFWAIASLGPSWSFRVLVRPGRQLVRSGPYRYLRHPNYLAIVGELLGMALIVRAPIAGALSLLTFGFLLHKRIAVEERALGLRAGTD